MYRFGIPVKGILGPTVVRAARSAESTAREAKEVMR
jgi:hypothetical protein